MSSAQTTTLSIERALACARATERRAHALLTAAVAAPAQQELARDIYARATKRSKRLQDALDLAVSAGGKESS